MKIILLAPSGAVASALGQLDTDSHDEILVVSRTAPDVDAPSIVVAPALRGLTRRSETLLGGSALGRNVHRLTPLDAGRRFARATRRHKALRAEVAKADLLVVLERDGILAGWHAARGSTPAHMRAVYGVPPAQAILAASRS